MQLNLRQKSSQSPAISVTDILYVFNTIELNAIKFERKSNVTYFLI